MTVPNILLSGIVGSTAYGLAAEDSDVDRLGLFARPTTEMLGIHPPALSVVAVKPDITYHEAGKYVQLALKCNPTIMELLWLPGDLYEVRTCPGDALIAIRAAFLSAPYVRNAYLGYAAQQFRRLENRSGQGDHSFSADTKKRTAKHARHLARLVDQGQQLYAQGNLTVQLNDPESYRTFGEMVAEGNLDVARLRISTAEKLMDKTESALPGKPDYATVQDWLLGVRKAFWT